MRLDKLVSSQSDLSRNDVKKLIKKGLITVDGKTASSPDLHVNPEENVICVNGQALNYKEHIYLMLNKPAGVVSATDDKIHKTVLDLVPDDMFREGLFPAGRLDADTTGFVLITDDGDFAHEILSPKNHVEKTYIARTTDPVSAKDIEALEHGIVLKDGFECMPAKVKAINSTTVEIKICEGKYHQIKRMFGALGNKIAELKRVKIGGLTLDVALKPGEMREITQEELLKITNG